MNTPTISVIIPTYNEEVFLPKLLETLGHQTVSPLEVIVCDGNSGDKTVEVAKRFAKKLPKLNVISCTTPGVSRQRNMGAAQAKGDWLLFLDADTLLVPHTIERLLWFIAKNKPKLFTTWFSPDTEEGSDAVFTLLGNLLVEGAQFLKRDVAPGPLTAIKREIFTQNGGYDETLKFGEDFDLTQRLQKEGVTLQIMRETVYIHSLRRMRNEGTIKFINTYATASLLALMTKKTFRHIPGYAMGGHLYQKQKNMTTSRLNALRRQVNALVRKLF